MKLVEILSYDTEFTTSDGAVRRYSHEYPSIGLAITDKNIPIVFAITDHAPVKNEPMGCTFENDGDSPSILFHDKGLNLDKFYSDYLFQGMADILEEKEVVAEMLEYPILISKYEYIKETLVNAGRFDFVRIVVEDIEAFNEELVENLNKLLADDPELFDVSDTEITILLSSNQLNFFDIFGIADWIESNSIMDFKDFPIKTGKVYYQEIIL